MTGGGGSVLGISMGTMRGGQLPSTNELPMIIQMPMQMEQTNNVPILNSILTSSGSGHNNNNNNNYSNGNPGSGTSGAGGGGGPGSTSTLKKRVQIQEVTV